MPKTETEEAPTTTTDNTEQEHYKFFQQAQEAFAQKKKETNSETEYLKAVELLLDEYSGYFRENSKVEMIVACPIGLTYFFKFLQLEFNSENLQSYIDTAKFMDLVEKESVSPVNLKKELEVYRENYLNSDSLMEINISGPVKSKLLDVLEALDNLSDDVSALESWKKTMLDDVFPAINRELLTNLKDPFSRFLHSKLFRELGMWIFSDSIDEYRDRISQKKDNQLILNNIVTWDKDLKVPHPLKILKEAFGYITTLLQMEKFWTKEGKLDHEQIQGDRSCKSWIFLNEMICQLQVVDLKPLSEIERLAFFINVFNLMMVHGSIATGGISFTVLKRTIFLKETYYNIGGELYSLDTILNGILRGNVTYSTSLSFSSQSSRFGKNDPKKEFILPYNSPDILFTLMTLTSISPDLVYYDPDTIKEQIKTTKEKFIKQFVIVNESSKLLILPTIFMEFKKDFKQKNVDIETSIQNFIGEALDRKLVGYKLKETESTMELNYLAYIPNEEFKEKILKIQPEKQEKKSKQTLQQIVDERLEKVKEELVPIEDVESLTKTQINGKIILITYFQAWILKFLSTNSGIEFTTKKTLFKTYENSFSTESLLNWFEKQGVTRENALKFVTKIHSMNVIYIASGNSKISDSSKQKLQIQTAFLDNIEEDCIYSSILIKKNNFFTKTTYQVYLYPNALILTDQGKVNQVIKIGNYDRKLEGVSSNFYKSIIQKCKSKTPQFEFVVLPYTAEKFTTKSHEDTDKWLQSFEKITGATIVPQNEQEEERFSLFRKSSSMMKIKNLEKQASLVGMAK